MTTNEKSSEHSEDKKRVSCGIFLFARIKRKWPRLRANNNEQRDGCSFLRQNEHCLSLENQCWKLYIYCELCNNSCAHINTLLASVRTANLFFIVCYFYSFVFFYLYLTHCSLLTTKTQESWKITLFNLLLWLFCLCFTTFVLFFLSAVCFFFFLSFCIFWNLTRFQQNV